MEEPLDLDTTIIDEFEKDDELYNDGYINIEKLNPIGRLAGNNYTRVQDSFEIKRKIKQI